MASCKHRDMHRNCETHKNMIMRNTRKSYDGGGEEEEALVVNVGEVLMYLCSSVDHVVVS